MKLYRAKEFFANCGGFIHKGQLFLVAEPNELPIPSGCGEYGDMINRHYEEIKPKVPGIKIESYVKAASPIK